MAPHGREVLWIGLYVVAVCVSLCRPAEAGPLPERCGSSQRLTADYTQLATDDEATIRIRICECIPGNWQFLELMVAESEELCRRGRPLSRLQWQHQVLVDEVSCVVTEPVDFDPALYDDELLLCPDNQPNWHTALTLVSPSPRSRVARSAEEEVIAIPSVHPTDPPVAYAVESEDGFKAAVITGLRVEEVEKGVTFDDGASVVLANSPVSMRLFGFDFSKDSQFRFVQNAAERGADCDNMPFSVTVNVDSSSLTAYSTLITFSLPVSDSSVADADSSPGFYLCSIEKTNGRTRWVHQGREPGMKLSTFQRPLPQWLQICILCILLVLSGLFSGLNLGLMALDRTELKIYENTGKENEKGYAKAIIPVRNHGNYLLCTLLLGNVLVNSTLTILLDDLTSGIVAVIGSTLGIVIFGEIIPQAICSRFGLAIGAHTVWITKFFMLITFPMSYPISLVLDRILGEEIGAYYNRERLKELIKVTNEYHDLEKEEVNIIAGALELRRKTVGDIMTRLEDVFMLSYESVLDFETVSEIMKQGFSRIPVYDGERSNIIALLFIKELALVDPEDATPLKTLCQFYQNACNFVFEDVTLDIIFKEFKEGHKGHMAFVQRVNCEGEGDPFYETVGLCTLEDVIEELIQAEIVDETDVWMDNRSKRKREKGKLVQDFSSFAVQYREQSLHKISPQLALATFQYLTSSIDPFKTELISENVLRRLMQHALVVRFIRVKNKDLSKSDPQTLIYQQGKPSDYFVLILEGRVEVIVGRENLMFESGPFTHFGLQAVQGINLSSIGDSPSTTQLFRGSIMSIQAPSLFETNTATPPTGYDGVGRGSLGGGSSRNQTFITDYTVRAITDVVLFRVSRSLYQAARSATLLERAQRDINDTNNELDRVLNSANKEEAESPNNEANEVTRSSESRGSQLSLNYHRSSVTSAHIRSEARGSLTTPYLMLNTANTQPVTTAAPESTWSPIAINQEEPRMATAATTATTVTTTTAATPLLATSSNPVADESEEPGDRTALLLDSSTPS